MRQCVTLLTAVLLLFCAGCHQDDGSVGLRTIYVSGYTQTLQIRDWLQLGIGLNPSNANKNLPDDTPVWTSSNDEVVSVTQDGVASALIAGRATVSVAWGVLTCSVDIEVDGDVDIKDELFLQFCLDRFDENGDGVIENIEISEVVGLDLSVLSKHDQIIDLSGLERFTQLQTLTLSFLLLDTLDVRQNKKLRTLVCDNSTLASIDLSQNTRLRELDCHSCAQLTDIQFVADSAQNSVETLVCFSCSLENLDLSACHALEYLDCRYNNLTSLDVSSCMKIKQISCAGNAIDSVVFAADYDFDGLITYDLVSD